MIKIKNQFEFFDEKGGIFFVNAPPKQKALQSQCLLLWRSGSANETEQVVSSLSFSALSLQLAPRRDARCFDRFCRSYMRYMMQRKGHGHQPSRRFPLYKKQRGGKSAALFE